MKMPIKIKTFVSKQIFDIKKYGGVELLRKFNLLIHFFLRFLTYIFAVIPCLVIRIISPWFIVRIEKLPASNFGDFVDFTAIYYCKKKLGIDIPKKKFLDLVYIHASENVFNKQVAKMWKRKMHVLPKVFLHPINVVNRVLPGWKNHSIEILRTKHERDVNNLYKKCQPILEFTSEEENYGKEMLKKFGLKEKDKFVCLCVRDSAYEKKKISPRFRDWSYHDYRNYNIDNFIPAAEELTKRGYYVFRMGVVVEKPIKSKDVKIIDYANSDLRSDFMDIYIAAKCSFVISTSCGFVALPSVFEKLNASLTVPLAAAPTHTEKYLLMTKHHVLKKEKRKLSLSEIFSYEVAYALDTKIFEEKGIELVENSPEEIRDLAIELVEIFENKGKKNIEKNKELQENFRNLFAFNIKRSIPLKETRLYWENMNLYHSKIRSSFSTKFLEQNKDWLR